MRAGYRGATLTLNVAVIVIGLLSIVRTTAAGGSAIALGYVLGVALVLVGALRLYLLLRTR